MIHKYLAVLAAFVTLTAAQCGIETQAPNARTGWIELDSFGTNPGSLNGYLYVPTGLEKNAPLVVALHGCTQNAATFARTSGWSRLADQQKFVVLYPEQQLANNLNRCFNWFEPADVARDQGEALSVRQMVRHAVDSFGIDRREVYVTGFSAGGAMTAVMLATYPDVFAAGASVAGIPYGAASTLPEGLAAMGGQVDLEGTAWAERVRRAFAHRANYPRLLVIQGTEDNIVRPANARELVEQWTTLHDVSAAATAVDSTYQGMATVTRTTYGRREPVVLISIDGLGHAFPIDVEKGGETDMWTKDVDFSAAAAAWLFFRPKP